VIFDILEQKLTRSLLLVPGESLFRSYMPPEVTFGAMTRVPLSGIKIDHEIENWYKGEMQIVTRHTDPVQGDILANKIAQILTVKNIEHYPASSERGPAHITLFLPETLPIRFPRLEGNCYEWIQIFNVAFGFKPKTLI
jgi:hypothetical protein